MAKKKRKIRARRQTFTGRLKSRKLLIGLFCLACGVAIDLLVPRGLSDNLLTLIVAILGIYVTGNVGSKAAESLGKQEPLSQQAQPQTPENDKAIMELQQRQQEYEQYLSGVLTTVEQLQENVNKVNSNVMQLSRGSNS